MENWQKKIFCCICKKNDGVQLKLFNTYTFARYSHCLKIHKDRKTKYADCECPKKIDNLVGYHPKCYESFLIDQQHDSNK